MDKRVRITFQNAQVVASIWDGTILRHVNAESLADMLVAQGITVDQVYMPDWQEGDISPTAGQKVAIFSRMRKK